MIHSVGLLYRLRAAFLFIEESKSIGIEFPHEVFYVDVVFSEDIGSLLGNLISRNSRLSSLLGTAIGGWVAGSFGLGGPWGLVIGAIVSLGLTNCLNPEGQSRAIMQEVDNRDMAIIPEIPSVTDITAPTHMTKYPAKVSASAKDVQINMQALVIPFTQTVTVKWSIYGHAAICHRDIARVDIFSNRDGGMYKPFIKEVSGGSDSGEAQVELLSGGYIARAVTAGDYSSASLTIEYMDVESSLLKNINPRTLAGIGINLAALGSYLIMS